MKEVIRIQKNEVQDSKPVEFTHYLHPDKGWVITGISPKQYYKVVYLGHCFSDGDMFSVIGKMADNILIFKGHLNSGKY